MCGLLYTKRLDGKSAKKTTFKRYQKQKTRGTDGYGAVLLDNDGLILSTARAQTEKELLEKIRELDGSQMLFHHRYPTSTPNFIESTHPIIVSHDSLNYDYQVIHNGVITNDEQLKKEHNKLGFNYTTEIRTDYVTSVKTYSDFSFNDSEAFAVDLARAIETGGEMQSRGAIAFIVLVCEKKSEKVKGVLFGRNEGNPLYLTKDKVILTLTSAINNKNSILLEPNVIFELDPKTGEIVGETPFKIGNYRSFTQGFGFTGGYQYGEYDMGGIDSPTKKYSQTGLNENDFKIGKQLENEYNNDEEHYWYLIEEIDELETQLKIMEGDPKTYSFNDMNETQAELDEAKLELKKYERELKLKTFDF